MQSFYEVYKSFYKNEYVFYDSLPGRWTVHYRIGFITANRNYPFTIPQVMDNDIFW